MVGFNRRFAPLVERLQAELGQVDDLVLSMRVNAGPLADDHWLHDPEDGGGRLLGEGCHFVDLLCHLAGSPAVSGHAVAVPQPGRPIECSDSFTAHIRFGNAVGTLVYSGGGDPRLPKERLEVFGGGVAAVLDDFRAAHRSPRREATRVEVGARQGPPRRDQAVPREPWQARRSRRRRGRTSTRRVSRSPSPGSLRTGRPVDMSAGGGSGSTGAVGPKPRQELNLPCKSCVSPFRSSTGTAPFVHGRQQ